MVIKAVKFRKDGFYSQPFAIGGEEGPDKFDKNIRYRGSLQPVRHLTEFGHLSRIIPRYTWEPIPLRATKTWKRSV